MYDTSSIKREKQEVSGRFTQQSCKATSRKCTKKRAACNQTHCCISQFWLPSPLNITRFYIQYEQTINIIYVLAPRRMHFQRSYLLWTALKVFLMHLGRNHRWRPWGFEKNNNHNQKKISRTQLYSLPQFPFSCIAEAGFCLFKRRQIVVLPRHFGQHIVGVLEITVYLITLRKQVQQRQNLFKRLDKQTLQESENQGRPVENLRTFARSPFVFW